MLDALVRTLCTWLFRSYFALAWQVPTFLLYVDSGTVVPPYSPSFRALSSRCSDMHGGPMQGPGDMTARAAWGMLTALVPALLMNVCIVGINQIFDVAIDKARARLARKHAARMRAG